MEGSETPKNRYALVIGIDLYDGGASLHGCVNDIDEVQKILLDRVGVPEEHLKRLASPHVGTQHETRISSQAPLLENIRKELQRLAGQKVDEEEPYSINEGDTVFIYYSGHGTQLEVRGVGGASYFCEALVPKDHVVDIVQHQYLLDVELNALLAAIAQRTSAVTVVLDCCCSAGATRDFGSKPGTLARFLPVDKPYQAPANFAPSQPRGHRGRISGIGASVQSCQVVAACLDDERAQESVGSDGKSHGELTRALIKHLTSQAENGVDIRILPWGAVWPAVLASVVGANGAQHPWLSGGYARPVFGGPPDDADTGFAVKQHGAAFVVSAGTIFGVSEGAELAIYGRTPPRLPALGSLEDRQLRAPRIRVTSATRATASAVAIDPIAKLPDGARARLVKAGSPERLRVALSPALPEIVQSVGQLGLAKIVEPSEPCDLAIAQRADGDWVLMDDIFGLGESPSEPVLVRVPRALITRIPTLIEHYYKYSAAIRIAKNCQDLPRQLRLTLHDARNANTLLPEQLQDLGHFPELPKGDGFPYVVTAGDTDEQAMMACVGVRNDSATSLRVAVIACNNSGRVVSLGQKVIGKGGAHVFWNEEVIGKPFPITQRAGHSLSVDRIIAIGTTNREASFDFLKQSGSFDEVLYSTRGTYREFDVGRVSSPPELWTSATTVLRIDAK